MRRCSEGVSDRGKENGDGDKYPAKVQNSVKSLRGREPSVCSQCGIKFRWHSSLQTHILCQHVQERPFSCIHCRKAFKQKSHLKAHILSQHMREQRLSSIRCDKAFTHVDHLHEHVKSQRTSQRSYPCGYCDMAFCLFHKLQSHMKRKHPKESEMLMDQKKPYAGKISEGDNWRIQGRLQNTSPQLNQTTRKQRSYKCAVCGKMFDNFGLFGKHLRLHSKKLKCNDEHPAEGFQYSLNIQEQMREERISGRKGCFPCIHCGKSYPNKSNLKRHILGSHTKDSPFSCPQCGRAFGSWCDLRRHLITHASHLPAQNRALPKKMKSDVREKFNGDYQVEERHTPNKPFGRKTEILKLKIFICKMCGELFTCQSKLLIHIKEHTRGRLHKCKTCGNCFQSAWNLKRHMLVHTEEKPYKCKLCGNTFKYFQSLRRHGHIVHRHLRVHSGHQPIKNRELSKQREYDVKRKFTTDIQAEKRHNQSNKPRGLKPNLGKPTCKVCGQTWSCRSALLVHMRKHTGERPYECKECGFCFKYSANLTAHLMKVHSEGKPVKCTMSKGNFSWHQGYRRHILTKHVNKRQHLCTECGNMFSTSWHLRRHIREVHFKKSFTLLVPDKLKHGRSANNSVSHSHLGKACNSQNKASNTNGQHKKEKQHKCTVCGRMFRRPSILRKHMSKHTGEKLKKCGKCGQAFDFKYLLYEHMKSHKGDQLSIGRVDPEQKKEKMKGKSKSVVLGLDNGSPSEEPLVPKSIKTKGKSLSCKGSGQSKSFQGDLLIHTGKHTGKWPYKCEKCGYCFKYPSNLKDHIMLVHSGLQVSF